MGRSKTIEDFPNYKVTDSGNVYNQFGKRLKPNLLKNGYTRVCLFNETEKRKGHSIHRLVAKAFIPNPNNYPQVNHKNQIKSDNRASNLEWCTPLENLNYSHVIEKAGIAKFTKVKCITTGEVFGSIKEASEKYNLYHANIVACCNGRRKHCGGFEWKYMEENKND